METIIEALNNSPAWYLVILGSVLGLIEISPIKVNPWTWLKKSLHDSMFGEITKSLDKIDKKITGLEEDNMVSVRVRIINFAETLKSHPSKEQFDQAWDDIDKYEKYCKDHPNFPNSKALASIDAIKTEYKNKII